MRTAAEVLLVVITVLAVALAVGCVAGDGRLEIEVCVPVASDTDCNQLEDQP